VDFSVEWLYTGLLGQADQLGNRVNFKLLHDAAAVNFDVFFGNLQFVSNLLVQHAGNDVAEDFIFARSEQIKTSADALHLDEVRSRLPVFFDGLPHCLQELLVIKGFGKEIDSAFFHGFDAHGDIAVTRGIIVVACIA
jgi:hypothetical protein